MSDQPSDATPVPSHQDMLGECRHLCRQHTMGTTSPSSPCWIQTCPLRTWAETLEEVGVEDVMFLSLLSWGHGSPELKRACQWKDMRKDTPKGGQYEISMGTLTDFLVLPPSGGTLLVDTDHCEPHRMETKEALET
eukprot:673930-Amphidinium_carterae.1